MVLLGDETAAPAIARILEDLAGQNSDTPCTAYIEVPTGDDQLLIEGAPHHGITWLPREGALRGSMLAPALGWDVSDEARISVASPENADDDLVWETPAYSGSGEQVSTQAPTAGTYYWIAGESGVVKQLRRFLVNEIGVDRSQVAFMGYWREGVAMKG
ncbi:siderophore-interacting protein [Flaviflexus massiliensis]|uniref:siderophore-interacting protein n=1 Tax=Flaviflexus massiliensis TaxID=1522309 RepID=UPI0021C31F8C|nr:siderophore-interacting protein [Flaviflexus massiliensis]